MKCVSGEKLIAAAAAISVELSCGLDSNEILALSDFFGMITANLITIGNRKLYIEDPDNDCCKTKKKNSQKTSNQN